MKGNAVKQDFLSLLESDSLYQEPESGTEKGVQSFSGKIT